MVVFMVAAMFLLLIGISYLVEKRRQRQAGVKPAMAPEQHPGLYIHPSHTFAKIIDNDTVEIGLDEFAQRAFGAVEFVHLPEAGAELQQGEPAWTLQVGERRVAQRMPVSGKIIDTQKAGGWVLKIQATNLANDLHNLIKGASYMTWLTKARAKFVADYAGELMPVLQDGGELADGFARHLTDSQWQDFTREFFNCETCDN